MGGIEPDWSRISEDILFSIVKLLPARIDILRLRAVCSSFRATIPPPPIQYPFPQSILTTTDFLKGPNPNINDVFNLTASTVYYIEPLNRISNTQDEDTPQTWLVEIHESNTGRFNIIDAISVKDCKKLSEKLPKSLNLLDYRVTEIGKFYELDSTVGFSFSKVVFSSFFDEHDDEFAVMASYDGQSKLGMWRNMDQKWSHIDIGLLFYESFEDIIYYNDKFYAVSPKGCSVTVDPKSLIVTQVAADLWFNGRFSVLYLVGSFNDLFLVVRYQEDNDDEDKYYIGVFKLNEKKRKWVRVVDGSDLVDRVLFVGGKLVVHFLFR
ncbi:F-box/kelch-repeat protein At1g64840-like [Pistacia vera]|uniref:F-box/kelch-repeat protein At1g64840-like n=1 Tax=Pistacia vera TaxID=55513 RepID=UPI001263157D|nr:F-box/kelch-repeat protein At1g64840-like [Pistacia vera]